MDTTTERRTSKRSSSDVDKMTSRTSKKTSSNNRTSSTSNKAAPKSTKFEPSDRLKADQKLQSKLYKASCLLVARFKKGLYFEPLACNGAEYFLSDREPFRNNSVPFQSLVKKDPPPRFVTNTGISQALDKNAPPEHRRRSESKASGVARDLLAEARTEAVELARRFQGDLGSYYRPDVDDTVPRLINSTQTVTIYRMEDVPAALQTDPKIGWISKHPVDDRDDGRTKAYDSAKNTSHHKASIVTVLSADESWHATSTSSRNDPSDEDESVGRHSLRQRQGTNCGAFWLMVGSDRAFEEYFVDTTNTRSFPMRWRKVGRSPLSQAQNCSEMGDNEEADNWAEQEAERNMSEEAKGESEDGDPGYRDMFFSWLASQTQ